MLFGKFAPFLDEAVDPLGRRSGHLALDVAHRRIAHRADHCRNLLRGHPVDAGLGRILGPVFLVGGLVEAPVVLFLHLDRFLDQSIQRGAGRRAQAIPPAAAGADHVVVTDESAAARPPPPPPRLVISPSMTPDSSAFGTSPNPMTTGFAFQDASTGFSAGPM